MSDQPAEPPIEWTTPQSLAKFDRMHRSMVDSDAHPPCNYCHERRRPLAMSGDGWGWESLHEEHCPRHDDYDEAHEVRIGPSFDLGDYFEAERILAATVDSEGDGDGRGVE